MTLQAQPVTAPRTPEPGDAPGFAISEWHDTDEVIDDAVNRFEDVMKLV